MIFTNISDLYFNIHFSLLFFHFVFFNDRQEDIKNFYSTDFNQDFSFGNKNNDNNNNNLDSFAAVKHALMRKISNKEKNNDNNNNSFKKKNRNNNNKNNLS